MHAVNLIAAALGKPEGGPETHEGVCCLTGDVCPCVSRDLALKNSFTNQELLRAPGSRDVSLDAYIALTHKWERMSSWWCDGAQFVRLDRQGVRNYVLREDMPEQWAGYATTSYKKHGALYAPVSGKTRRHWRFENRTVDISDRKKVWEIWNRLNIELRAGVPRTILATLEPDAYVCKQVGIKYWLEFEAWARPLKETALYAFLLYLLPSLEELREEQKQGKEYVPSYADAMASARDQT